MCAEIQPKPVKSSSWIRKGTIYISLLIIVFLLGFVPMWLKSRKCSYNLSEVEHELILARIHNSLASAVIEAQKGNYELARLAASDFYTSLRAVTDRVDDSTLSLTQREEVQPLLNQRDEIITLLARGDLASADRLSDLYGSYSEIMNR